MSNGMALRVEQVGLLTAGLELPLDAVPMHVMRIIARELVVAWKELEEQAPRQTSRAEKYVNASMEAILKRRIRERQSVVGDVVRAVARGAENLSFDGESTEVRPDLSLYMTERPFPLLVECKIVDASSKPVKLYCDNGVQRFTIGKYGWQQREGFLMAYVRDGSSIASCLRPHLMASKASTPDPNLVEGHVKPVVSFDGDLACSTHGRGFVYLHPPGKAPGSVELWHLWVKAEFVDPDEDD